MVGDVLYLPFFNLTCRSLDLRACYIQILSLLHQNKMASTGLQILGMALALIGWIGTIITCAMPMWRVTAFIGNSIVVAQIIWEGLWMNCIVQSTGQMQCKIYDSMLALPQDLQAARALTVISILVAILGLLASIIGAKCTKCVEEENAKAKICVVSGIIFVISGVLILIPVCWSANSVIRDFYNPLVVEAQKRELGASLYIGWASAALLLLGGGLLCCSCPKKEENFSAQYTAAPSQARSNYSSKNYV
ncbi:claudin-4-like isoform X1 [Pleurodeles waltl]|uniref:claudin-4-like isoform X1 n=1 Tax=Pleurodeles waltl TaxID=8319 RepID=UPI0037099674